MNPIANNIKQRLSLRKPLGEALDVVAMLTDKLALKKPNTDEEYKTYLAEQLTLAQEVCKHCKSFEREFPSFAFSIATGIGKTRLMAACIAYLYLKKGIRHFFILAPNLTLYEKLKRDFGEPSYEKYVFKGLAEFVANPPLVVTSDNYNSYQNSNNLFNQIEINIFNISKFNSENRGGAPRMRRLSEYIGQSYFDYLASLDDLVILMDEAHRYHADASKKAVNELRPILGLEMTATPTDEKGKPFRNIVYEYNLAQALEDGKYVKIPTVARRRNFEKGSKSDDELDMLKIEDAINIHERTKVQLELYARNNGLPIVKPFILIVCRNIEHATSTLKLIENDLFDGRYANKVLQIDSSTKKDEEVEKLFLSLEKPDNRIEIVIHVNMLKEGWDVTNLYTIVPLRAADAPILVEQSIGRGLRLPYGKRTGEADVDKLTVIAHENFQAVIDKANDPNSVLSRFSYIELDNEDLLSEPSRVETVQTIIDLQCQQGDGIAKTDVLKQNINFTTDTLRAVFNAIPVMSDSVKTKEELNKPEIKELIKSYAIKNIRETAKQTDPLFAEQVVKEQTENIEQVVEMAVKMFIENTIAIPRMTMKKEIFKAEYKWFDLNTTIGFDLPTLKEEIIRITIGAGNKETEIFEIEIGHKLVNPLDVLVATLVEYDDIDYDENAELLYHLAQQAIDAITANLNNKEDLPNVVNSFKKVIANNIYGQMKNHFVVTSMGYIKPKVQPFVGIVEQNVKVVDGYGRINYQTNIPPSDLRKYVFTDYIKSYYTEYKFDSKTEHDFSFVLENDSSVIRWLRPAREQFNIYWDNGSKRYEPDFIVETADTIYMIETKAATNMSAEDVQMKKRAAEDYCKYASEFAIENNSKPWKYVLLSHDKVNRTASFDYLIHFDQF